MGAPSRRSKEKMNYPFVSFIIVNFNGKKYLRKCFDSILNLDYPKEKIEIIMVDNGSKDSSVSFVKKNYPTIKVLRNKENNYCSANNLGISKAKGEFVALSNNDAILNKNWLKELVKEITSDEKIGGTGGKILFFNGRIQSAGQEKLADFWWRDIGFKEKNKGQYDKKKEVISLSGAAVLYRKKFLTGIGGFDEDFRMYCDEADIGMRARKKGWKLVYVPTAIAHHKFMGTAKKPEALYYCHRNRLLLIAKYEPELLSKVLPASEFFANNKPDDIKKEISFILRKAKLKATIEDELLIRIFSETLAGLKAVLLGTLKRMREIRLLKNRIIHDRNRFIKEKEAFIRQKQRIIDSKEKLLQEKRHELNEKETELNERKKEINKQIERINQLNRMVAGKEKEIKDMRKEFLKKETNMNQLLADKEKMIKQRDKSLKEIYDSRGWKFLTAVHNTKKRLGVIK